MSDKNNQVKQSDEMYCRSCGEIIKKKAEICPHCGVRNEKGAQLREQTASKTPTQRSSTGGTSQTPTQKSTKTKHDPSEYETTVSENWWYGIAAGVGLWIFIFIIAPVVPDSIGAVIGLISLMTWIGLPIAAYFDIKYIRANSKWNPTTILWVIVLFIWFINIIAGLIYLYRRHEVLGVP